MKNNKIYLGDAKEVLQTFPDESIECCISSPPYWALRDYDHADQLGLEPDFQEYITKLCDIYVEVKRVLKKTGTCFVVIGDTYYGSGKSVVNAKSDQSLDRSQGRQLPSKTMVLIPHRFAIEMLNRGWILRNTIIWHKPNVLTTSAKDRFAQDFEYVFFFVKNRKYDFNQLKEPAKYDGRKVIDNRSVKYKDERKINIAIPKKRWTFDPDTGEALRVMRTVWCIPTGRSTYEHYASYPEELCYPMIDAGCKIGGTVLDCFSGSGTTLRAAHFKGRKWIGIDINPKYVKDTNTEMNKLEQNPLITLEDIRGDQTSIFEYTT